MTTTGEETAFGEGFGPNEWLIDEMHESYLADPSSVSPDWQAFFAARGNGGNAGAVAAPTAAPATPAPAPTPT
ncbi:MAG TPA: hypothetical protein VHE83_13130, partial [Mycobacteriales bacterium]|nr:hypothetical protein [Mycobacteriales bacterium]